MQQDPDGQEYIGNFKQGLRNGRGSLTFVEGAVYEGRWKDDDATGQGTLKMTLSCVPGATDDEMMFPIDIQTDIRRIHAKAGFNENGL